MLTHDDSDGLATQPEQAPIDRILRTVAVGLFVTVLIAALSLVLYARTLGPPRTALERDILAYRAAVEERPEQVEGYLLLAEAYAVAGRADEAARTIRAAREISDAAVVDFAEAETVRLLGSPAASIEHYTAAERRAVAQYEEALERLQERGVGFEPDGVLLARIYMSRALAYLELDRAPDAVKDLESAHELLPMDADILVALGDARLAIGDEDGARTAYLEALRFVPDSPEARAAIGELEGGHR